MKTTFNLILIFTSIIALSNCATIKNNKNEEIKFSNSAKSLSGDFEINFPSNWYVAEDNKDQTIMLWLVRNDYQASLTITEIHTNENSENIEHTIKKLLSYSKALYKVKLGKSFKEIKKNNLFELDDKTIGEYIIEDETGMPLRVVIFKHNKNFYEFKSVSKSDDSDFITNLNKTQDLILTTIH